LTLEAAADTADVDRAHARVGPDTIAKILFTSGSTGDPKGVINTHRMLCANQQQILSALQFLGDEPPVLCDWLPWNHTFGGNHNVGIALYNGGTLFIDEGRPVPGAMDTTVANLREVATTAYFNVPKGFDMLLPVLRADAAFRAHFFSRLQLLFYAAAGLRSEVADAYQQLAMATVGRAIPWVTGLGATETAPAAMFTGPLLSTAAHIGVPIRGVELKAVPIDGRLEARVKGPNVTPGYWGDAALTQAAFDEDGYYRMGDAITPADPSDLTRGFVFQGRLNEDFKLSTGTWVRVGAIRARLLATAGDLVQDAVITGHGRDDVGALLFPNVSACRALAGADTGASVQDVLANASVRAAIADRLDAYNAGHPGSSTAIRRARLLDTPPSLDMKELTDKGSLNQRAVLSHRAPVVDDLYASTAITVLC
jgi:feruloyl-CoA synthase